MLYLLRNDPRHRLLSLIIFLGVVLFFSPLLSFEDTNWDDGVHSFSNPLVLSRNPTALGDLFLVPDSVNRTYIPLTILTFSLQAFWGGTAPWISHLINILLHASVTVIVLRIGFALNLSRLAACFAALLFAVHPLHVEPVAWVTSRKDVLYGFFFLSALLFYLRFIKTSRGKDYILSLICAALSILAKPMALSLPFILLLFDYFHKRHFCLRVCLEKLPYVLVVVPVAMITYLQNSRIPELIFPESILVFLWSAGFYIEKLFLPLELSPLYAPPVPVIPHFFFYGKTILLLFLVISLTILFRRSRWLVMAFLFYVFCTFYLWRPDGQDITIVGDRFMYIPSVGFFLAAGAAISACLEHFGRRRILCLSAAFIILFLLSWTSFSQMAVWKNCWTLWRRVLQVTPAHPVAMSGQIKCMVDSRGLGGCSADIVKDIRRSYLNAGLEIPHSEIVRRLDYFIFLMARRQFRTYSGARDDPDLLDRMGHLYCLIKAPERGVLFFEEAVLRFPWYSNAWLNQGLALLQLANYPEAIHSFDRYLVRWPDDPQAYFARAGAYYLNGQLRLALEDARKASQLDPEDKNIRAGFLYYQQAFGSQGGL